MCVFFKCDTIINLVIVHRALIIKTKFRIYSSSVTSLFYNLLLTLRLNVVSSFAKYKDMPKTEAV